MKSKQVDFTVLPPSALPILGWEWSDYQPYIDALLARPLDAAGLDAWMRDWTRVSELIDEAYARLHVAQTVNTADEEADRRYRRFLETIFPAAMDAGQKLKEKLLASGLTPADFIRPLMNMKTEAEIFREANLPLLTQERILSSQYDKITGAQTVEWEGREITIVQLRPVYQEPDRPRRECAWRLAAARQLADRTAINDLWKKMLDLRGQMARNADFPDYRAFRWRQFLRFDYTPADCETFQRAIARVVVPAAARLDEKRRRQMGVATLRPWDLDVDPLGRPPLKPFAGAAELEAGAARIFDAVDPELGNFFRIMREEKLLDLENRKGKAPGGFCTTFSAVDRPFIFMNAVGVHDDVQTLLHEGGHAFHVFQTAHLPYEQQKEVPMEFAEVASMSMELLSAPYLTRDRGGFYSPAEAARARIQHLEANIRFWPYMAVVDAFQHWVYTHQAQAADPAACDAQWGELWRRYLPSVDYSGLEDELVTGWQRKLHIHKYPFYYVEYGLAQLGAAQVWRNALKDQAGAVAAYRRALSRGGLDSLPGLFAAAGAVFAFDAGPLAEMVQLMENTIAELENDLEK